MIEECAKKMRRIRLVVSRVINNVCVATTCVSTPTFGKVSGLEIGQIFLNAWSHLHFSHGVNETSVGLARLEHGCKARLVTQTIGIV